MPLTSSTERPGAISLDQPQTIRATKNGSLFISVGTTLWASVDDGIDFSSVNWSLLQGIMSTVLRSNRAENVVL
ncbi:uncharacterized protein N7446_010677 [Penicillium canescens]|uniref:Uncharacterized protein n=1 Tax=Penicillium canescens TaxID=5083 RepID=A0AAD6IBB3_PENCN|nr:uncharacterized protein N7446_010677 [Penicillium canescens]KAJ6041434.1 hypothetical protein N7460_006824 [Penicillium canescens]KAJ6050568.1 hypothetical protein N7446_010677 [Penicillium canescens]KAJ6065788.1 hypothetical protein N7444_001441 [Penicillium canescens]